MMSVFVYNSRGLRFLETSFFIKWREIRRRGCYELFGVNMNYKIEVVMGSFKGKGARV